MRHDTESVKRTKTIVGAGVIVVMTAFGISFSVRVAVMKFQPPTRKALPRSYVLIVKLKNMKYTIHSFSNIKIPASMYVDDKAKEI